MANEIGGFLNAIGNILAHDTAHPLDDTFLYVEAESGMIAPSVFKDLGDRLLYRWASDELCDILSDLWYAEVPGKRWSTMQYRIAGGKFEASFTYVPLDPKETLIDRRDGILQQRYGNKQIVYPPLPRTV